MEIQIKSSRILPPQHDLDTFPKEIPLTIFDRFATNSHVGVIWAFAAPTPTNKSIINGLCKTLQYFPTLTAQINQSQVGMCPCLVLGGSSGGVLLVEATVNSKLSDHLPLEPTADFLKMHPSTDDPVHVFQVQLSRFKDDGLVISITAHHRVADGQSMSLFFSSWARMVRGEPLDQLPVYYLSWLKPRRPPRREFNHWGQEFMPTRPSKNGFTINHVNVHPSEITNVLLRYPDKFIQTLKAKINNEYTTFETILGYRWRTITIARGLKDEENTLIRLTVNARRRLNPPVSCEFFGNLVVNAYPKSNVKKLIAGGIAFAAGSIHEAVNKANHNYTQSFIAFGELYGDEELNPVYDNYGNVVSPELEVDSWLGFKFEDMDFGNGARLAAFLPTWCMYEGLVILVPGTLSEGGGIGMFATMLIGHANILKNISHSID